MWPQKLKKLNNVCSFKLSSILVMKTVVCSICKGTGWVPRVCVGDTGVVYPPVLWYCANLFVRAVICLNILGVGFLGGNGGKGWFCRDVRFGEEW